MRHQLQCARRRTRITGNLALVIGGENGGVGSDFFYLHFADEELGEDGQSELERLMGETSSREWKVFRRFSRISRS
jgi:hypothetical protein